MAPERRLIPSEDDTVQTTTRTQCTSNVVGVIPPKIHEILTATGGDNASTQGRIDDHSSGISFLLGTGNESNTISLWEHATQTLNEELLAPSGLCVKLTHPEHASSVNEGNDGQSDLLVACLGPNNSAEHTHPNGRMYGRDQGRTLRHVYAASPTTGVLCVWVLDTAVNKTTAADSGGVECDASVRLKLKAGEVLTSLTPMNDGASEGNTTWLLASTSLGRLWKVYKTSRPLTLHAKMVKRKMISESNGSSAEEEEDESGIVRGLYNYFTTPSKKAPSREDDAVMDGGNMEGVSEDEDIIALIPMPPTMLNEEGVTPIAPASERSPMRTPGGPSPRKQARISTVPSADTSCARAISLSSSLVLKEWKISLLSGMETEEVRASSDAKQEGYTSRTQLFSRHADGSLNLASLKSNSNANEMEESLEGYSYVDVLATPSLSNDGKSLLAVIRIAKENDVDNTRVYVLRIGLVPLVDGQNSPYIIDAAWLDRYSGQSLSVVGGTLECAGLVVAEVEEENAPAESLGGAVAYVGFGPRAGCSGQVTISAVHFATVNAAGGQIAAPRVKDLDIYSDIVPSIIQHSLSYDSLTGGCVLLATSGLLCGAYVRFPIAPMAPGTNISRGEEWTAGLSLDEASLALFAQDEMVLTIKSHLQSAFRQYLHKIATAPARAVVPPSVGTCPSHVLSAAVVLASKDFVCATSSNITPSMSPFSPTSRAATSPVTVLRDKLQSHRDFVTFLLHAGAYRRVLTAGRIRLRDHGEMITAARALFIECQGYFSKAEAATGDNHEIARQMVMTTLENTSNNVFSLPLRWVGLQQLSVDSVGSPLGRDLLLLTSSSICQGIGQALRYRQNESSSLYDIPSYDSSSPSSYISLPWTSSHEMLEVFFSQLQAIQQSGESILSASLDYDTQKANLRQYVEDISASALSGHHDIVLHGPDSDEATKAYEETKLLAVPLLRQYANNNDENGDDDDLVALQTSLAHSFFEGIVQICHDHRKSWRYQGPFSDQEADKRYDIRPMMSNTSSDSPYGHLHQTRDYRTDLSFCGYVLRWYADRGHYPEVFELGKNCPHDLTRYVRNDDRLSHLAWIQHLRVGAHEQATVGLLSLTSPIIFGDKQPGGAAMGLWENDLLMSLSKLASAKSTNLTVVDGERRKDLIDNRLTLVSAQRILQKDTEQGDEIALSGDCLLRLAVEKISSARDVDEIKRFGICGLALASAKPLDQVGAMANDASSIWCALIEADIHTWQSVANDNNMSVGGMSEEELIQRVEGTAFVGVMYDFVTTSSEGKMQNVGFLIDQVRNQVFHSLGSDELGKVLYLSSDIVAAAN